MTGKTYSFFLSWVTKNPMDGSSMLMRSDKVYIEDMDELLRPLKARGATVIPKDGALNIFEEATLDGEPGFYRMLLRQNPDTCPHCGQPLPEDD